MSMHILLVNDDGPPSEHSSPYIHSFVKALQEVGHVVSVCLPHTQRSWIGKAHFVGQSLKPLYYRPGTLHKNDGTTHSRPLPPGSKPQEEWILVDGTPASCVQIGLYHYFQDLGPIDLVVSGPNYGRNSTAVFALSSGTLGGALEAATCRKKAIAVSYAFEGKTHDFDAIDATSKHAVRIIGHLCDNWGIAVDVYSVNVPVREDVASRKILKTNMLQNYWGPYSCFEEVEDESGAPDEEEQIIRERESVQDNGVSKHIRHKHKHFKWAPRFTDVFKSVRESEPGNDGWALQQGFTSVTPVIANFWHAELGTEGELTLPLASSEMKDLSISEKSSRHVYAFIDYEEAYVQPLIVSSLARCLPRESYTIVNSAIIPNPNLATLHIGAYEQLPFEDVCTNPDNCLANAYIIRKALIRKNYLLITVRNWISKHPSSILATNVKPSCDFELDYAEFLDDALVEAWELQASFRNNETKESPAKEWWILKPGMSDRGQGIRLFSTHEELQAIFDEWEAVQLDSDDEGEEESENFNNEEYADTKESGHRQDYIMTSHLRHFIAQPYIHPPLLLPLPNNPSKSLHKFHIRTYVLAVGSLKVYVYRPMLALFASTPYSPPWTSPASAVDLSAHLTNTCSQDASTKPISVQLFWSLPFPSCADLSHSWKDTVFTQICALTGEVFEAAARSMTIHFQTLPNAFEVFGLDFLVDEHGKTWLLEVNAFPDFGQTGDELRGVVGGLWDGVVKCAVRPFFGIVGGSEGSGCGAGKGTEDAGDMVLVRELNLGRK